MSGQKEEAVIEEKKVTSTFKTAVIVLSAIIINVFAGGMFYANLENDIEGKADRGDFEKYKAIDSVNDRNIFMKLDKMEDKFDRLLEKNNITVPKNLNEDK